MYALSAYVSSYLVDIITIVDIIAWLFLLLIFFISIIGIFNYAYEKNILSKTFWKIHFFLIIIFQIIYPVFQQLNSDVAKAALEKYDALEIIKIFIVAILLLPQYIAIYNYAWKKS